MRFHRNKNIFKSILYSWFTITLIFVISVALIYNVIGLIKKNKLTKENRQRAADQLASLEVRETELQSELDKLRTDRGIEETLRDKFGVVKEGEGLIIIVDDPDNKKTEDNPEKSNGFFQFFKNIFTRN